MSWLQAPKTNRYFWLCHLAGIGAFVLINFFSRQFSQLESLEQGVVSAVILLLSCTLVCVVLRECLHRFALLNFNTRWVWGKILVLVLLAGFIAAALTVLGLSLYYLSFGYVTRFVFFMSTVMQNWLVLSLVIGIWTVVYVVVQHADKLNQTKIQLKEAQLNNLIGQLNPHFLFNGLNNIRGLMLEDVPRSRQMLTAMSELLRHALQAPKHELIPLSQELEVVNSYVSLAQIQYEHRLDFQREVSADSRGAQVPPLMIQLLVENAIKHGIDRHPGALQLRITTAQQQLHISVTNPGHFQPDAANHGGVGLANIQKRLHLLFGDHASLQVKQAGDQVVAELVLPLVTVLETAS